MIGTDQPQTLKGLRPNRENINSDDGKSFNASDGVNDTNVSVKCDGGSARVLCLSVSVVKVVAEGAGGAGVQQLGVCRIIPLAGGQQTMYDDVCVTEE